MFTLFVYASILFLGGIKTMKKEMFDSLLVRCSKYCKGCKSHAQKFLSYDETKKFVKDCLLDLNDLDERGELLNNIKPLAGLDGNSKLSGIATISFCPFISCLNQKCFQSSDGKKPTCYGTRGKFIQVAKLTNSIINSYFLEKHPKAIEIECASACLTAKNFRWCENGDIMRSDDIKLINKIAKNNPGTNFLLMTKQFSALDEFLANNKVAKNLTIRPSLDSLDGVTYENKYNLPLSDIFKNEAPKNAFICKSNECKTCKACWSKNIKMVVYEYHL